jgi:pimeloyl-ACP methyl ester carboxylesterase
LIFKFIFCRDKPFNHEYTISEQADIVEDLLQYLNVSHIHILNHDYGVSVGQELLARDQERKTQYPMILSICFLNGGIFPDLHRPRLVQTLLLNDLVGPFVSRLISYSSFKKSFGEVFGRKPSEEEFRDYWALIEFNNGQFVNHRF